MSYIAKNLLPGERIVYRAYLHWVIYVPAIVLLLIAAALFVAASQSSPESRAGVVAIGLVFVVVGLIAFLLRWITHKTSEFGVTDKRVLIKVGLVRRTSLELLLRQIEAIGVEQGILARVLGYGTIIVAGTGGTKESFGHISHPLEFRKQVQGQSLDTTTPVAPVAPVDEKTCPACAERVKAAAKICRFCGHKFE